MGWSVYVAGLDVDLKNEFLSYFPNFNYEGGVLSKSETHSVGSVASDDEENLDNHEVAHPNRQRRHSRNRPACPFVEPVMITTATRYLNRLDKMGFTIISSTVDSSVENNYNKKCYVWTVQRSSSILPDS